MQVARADLLEALASVAPALGQQSPVAALKLVWFQEGEVSAYNGFVGIAAPLSTKIGVEGGVEGKLLLSWLAGAKADTISVAPAEGVLTLNSGRSTLKLPLTSIADRLWEAPIGESCPGKILLTEELLSALARVQKHAASANTPLNRQGVTLVPEDMLNLYASDNATLAWDLQPLPEGWGNEPKLLPLPFLKLLQKLFKAGGQLYFLESGFIAEAPSGLVLFGHPLAAEQLLEFGEVVDRYLPQDLSDRLLPLPQDFSAAIGRMAALARGRAEKMLVYLNESKLSLTLKLPQGDLTEALELEGTHERMAISFNPLRLKEITEGAAYFAVTRDCFISVTEDNLVRLLAAGTEVP